MNPHEAEAPHGGVRPFQKKSTCLTQLTLGPDVVHIWSRDVRKFELTTPSNSTEWGAGPVSLQKMGKAEAGGMAESSWRA